MKYEMVKNEPTVFHGESTAVETNNLLSAQPHDPDRTQEIH